MVAPESSFYPYDPNGLVETTGYKRGRARLGRPSITWEETDELTYPGVCRLCSKTSVTLPNGVCLTCQTKKVYGNHYYVKLGTKIEFCNPRMPQKAGAQSGLYPIGWIMGAYPCTKFASTRENELEAIVRRVAMPCPNVDPILWERFECWCKPVFERIVKYAENTNWSCHEWSFAEFTEWNQKYPKQAQRKNETAFNENRVQDCEPDKVVTSAFLKSEKDSGVGFDGPEDKVPRLIQPFRDRVKVATACAFTQIQSFFHTVVSIIFPHSRFSAGDNAIALSDWWGLTELYPVKGCNDFTNYDATFHLGCHKLVQKLYNQLGIANVKFAQYYRKQQESPTGYTRHGIRYHVAGTMRSGAADTCLSNSLISLLVHQFIVSVLGGSDNVFAMACMGDDTLLAKKPSLNCDCMDDYFVRLGFLPKLRWGLADYESVYLNMLPYPSSDGARFAPLIGRLLGRIGYSVEPRDNWATYVVGVAKAFLCSCNHVPILRKLFSGQCSSVVGKDGYEKTADFRREWGDKGLFRVENSSLVLDQPSEATNSTFDFVANRYGLTVDQILEAEDFIERSVRDGIPKVLFHPVLEKICEVDL